MHYESLTCFSVKGFFFYSWLKSGIWAELETHKEVLCEMRGNKDFLPTIEAYYRSVSHCERGVGKGPLLFAIMRGKVSEGLDFADNRARGVITVSQLHDNMK
jgi:Fanconi anemia group J protein